MSNKDKGANRIALRYMAAAAAEGKSLADGLDAINKTAAKIKASKDEEAPQPAGMR